jgi:uncharacterized protein YcbK (DUF882 family)
MESKKLTAHFNLREFHCRDGTEVPESHEEALRHICEYILEPLRRKFGVCHVHSGFRTDSYNARVGGARSSYHRYHIHRAVEVAVDVSFATGSPAAWKREAVKLLDSRYGRTRGGVGYYPRGGFVHIDTRKAGRAYWDGP